MKQKIIMLLFLAVISYANAFAQPGALDTSFGTRGKVALALTDNGEYLSGLAIQNDGKILVTGTVRGHEYSYVLMNRLNTDGTPEAWIFPNFSDYDSYS